MRPLFAAVAIVCVTCACHPTTRFVWVRTDGQPVVRVDLEQSFLQCRNQVTSASQSGSLASANQRDENMDPAIQDCMKPRGYAWTRAPIYR
jgi:hypothetical protein